MTTTFVGVDAVLSADVGGAPIRQRQYTAPVDALSAQAPHAERETLLATGRLLASDAVQHREPNWRQLEPFILRSHPIGFQRRAF